MGLKEWIIKKVIINEINKFKKENTAMMKWIDGKKMYITGIGTMIYGWAGYAAGLHDLNKAIELTLGGFGIIAAKSAINKIGTGTGGNPNA